MHYFSPTESMFSKSNSIRLEGQGVYNSRIVSWTLNYTEKTVRFLLTYKSGLEKVYLETLDVFLYKET